MTATGYSERPLRRALAELRAHGLLKVVEWRFDRNSSTIHRLSLPCRHRHRVGLTPWRQRHRPPAKSRQTPWRPRQAEEPRKNQGEGPWHAAAARRVVEAPAATPPAAVSGCPQSPVESTPRRLDQRRRPTGRARRGADHFRWHARLLAPQPPPQQRVEPQVGRAGRRRIARTHQPHDGSQLMSAVEHVELIRQLAAAHRPYGWSDESIDGYLLAVGDLDAVDSCAALSSPPSAPPRRCRRRPELRRAALDSSSAAVRPMSTPRSPRCTARVRHPRPLPHPRLVAPAHRPDRRLHGRLGPHVRQRGSRRRPHPLHPGVHDLHRPRRTPSPPPRQAWPPQERWRPPPGTPSYPQPTEGDQP